MLIIDRLNLSTERKYTPEGFLTVPATIGRTGIQEYTALELGLTDRKPNEIIKVFRSEDEVFHPESLSSFSNKPVTDGHPPELVNASNSKSFTVGMAGSDISRNGDFINATLNITDEDAIKGIESGKVEVSNGYLADIILQDGVTESGLQFDAVQKNIRGNHIAIVDRGRAGSSCRIADNLNQPKGEKMADKTVVIDGVSFEVSDQVSQAISKLTDKIKESDTALAEKDLLIEKNLSDSNAKADELQAKLDDALSKVLDPNQIDALVVDRLALIDALRKIDDSIVWDGKSSDMLKKEVVSAKCANVKVDDVSADYINARFDMLVEASNDTQLNDGITQALISQQKQTDVDNRPADVIAREKMISDSKSAWKKTESK